MTWDRLAEITGQFLSKGQLVDVEGRLQTRQRDDDAGKRSWIALDDAGVSDAERSRSRGMAGHAACATVTVRGASELSG
jgi:single-stranded DNA-binding protein